MSEQRLIDVDALKEKEQYIPCGNGLLFHGVTAATIDAMPTIAPETLPIVRELREKLEQERKICDGLQLDLAECAQSRDALIYLAFRKQTPCVLCENNGDITICPACQNGSEWLWNGDNS